MSDQSIDPRLDTISDCLYRISAKAVILRDNKIFLTHEVDKWWSLPGGGINHDETVEAALKRELSEELSVTPEEVLVHQPVLHAAFENYHGIPRAALLYRVELPDRPITTSDHVLGCGWFSAEEVSELYISPTIGGKAAVLQQLQQAHA